MDSTKITIEGLMAEKAESIRQELARSYVPHQQTFKDSIAAIDHKIATYEQAISQGLSVELNPHWEACIEGLKKDRDGDVSALAYCVKKAEEGRAELAAIERFLASMGVKEGLEA